MLNQYNIQQIENGWQSEIFIARNGKTVAKIVAVKNNESAIANRIGFAKGKLVIDDDFEKSFDELDSEITNQLTGFDIAKQKTALK